MVSRWPIFISLLGMISGVIIAILFGVNEDIFKGKIAHQLEANQKIQSIEDIEKREAKIAKEKTKNWRYYQRFHFHATGIGSMSLAALLLLGFLNSPKTIRLVSSYLVSVGGFLYPFVWLFAALYGPEIGRSAAKEKFAFFGYMGGVFLLGLILVAYQYLRYGAEFHKGDE